MNEGLTDYLAAFMDELVHSGIRHMVVSPGSRSTPLALLAAEHPEITLWMNIDERSAGFFALGMAKADHQPVALVCTSGTAAANYLPAVTEAHLSRIPLLVLTADRPPELRDVGAPQTINQVGLYGEHVKWFMEMPIPESSSTMIRHARTTAARAAAITSAEPSGPVHLNFPLREPLLPDFDRLEQRKPESIDRSNTISLSDGIKQVSQDALQQFIAELSHLTRGLFICGPLDVPGFPSALTELAEALHYPILADPLSQLRNGEHNKQLVLDKYDIFLRNSVVCDALRPEVIIRFGAMPVSKSLMLYLNRYPDCRHIVIDEGIGWRDPTLQATDMIYAQPEIFCRELIEHLPLAPIQSRQQDAIAWCDQWITYNQVSDSVVTQCMATERFSTEQLFEGRLFYELQDLMPDGSTLFVGNSMPIRDLDAFYSNNDRNVRIMGNRGANGIDGLISTALGICAAGERVVLVLGDLSFYHDMNGLLAAKLHELNITIVIVNNDGGGIFSFLPQAKHPKHFELLFGTPTGLDFAHAVKLYEGSFVRADSWEHFRKAFRTAEASNGLQVIEIPTDREQNVSLHKHIWQTIFDKLEGVDPKGDQASADDRE